MANREEVRLFELHCGKNGNVHYTHIEAKNAVEAIRKSSLKNEKQEVIEVTSEPIFNASLGVEANEGETGNEVFEINVRGTSEEMVEKLRDAIALAIGGMAVECANLNATGESDNGAALQRFIGKAGIWITSI